MADLPPFQGNFFRSVARSAAQTPTSKTSPGTVDEGDAFLNNVVDKELEDCRPVTVFPEEVSYHIHSSKPVPTVIAGATGTAAVPEDFYVYLDVGAWYGSPGGKWAAKAAARKIPGSPCKRDFGIICGPHVLLCTFAVAWGGAAPAPTQDAGWDAISGGSQKDIASITAVLKALSSTANGLGAAIVSRYLRASSLNQKWVADEGSRTVHVIMGDTHIPMLDTLEQAMAGGTIKTDWLTSAAGALLQMSGVNNNIGLPRVRRHGRLDLGPIEQIVTNAVSADDDNMKGISWAIKSIESLKKKWDALPKATREIIVRTGQINSITDIGTILATPALLGGLVASLLAGVGLAAADWIKINDLIGVWTDTMTTEHAKKWFHYYRDGDSATAPAADIFEQAGQHFADFVGALASYKAAGGNNAIQFHQLGDMFDYWVGFTCHYKSAGSNVLGLSSLNADWGDPADQERGRGMIAYWTKNCLERTQQGRTVAQALEVAATGMSFPPSYLSGNHDNYLGAAFKPSYSINPTTGINVISDDKQDPNETTELTKATTAEPDDGDPKDRRVLERSLTFAAEGIFMEHGHQWDSSNRNNAPTKTWAAALIGTAAPQGEVLTQAAFLRPNPIRMFEGTAFGAAAAFSPVPATHPYGQRFVQIAYAADKWFNTGGSFYVYAMGHTHAANLVRVVIRSDTSQSVIDAFRADHQTDGSAQVHVDNGTDSNNVPLKELFHSNGGNPTSVTVKWEGLMGLLHHDWIALDDPDQMNAEARVGLWKWVGDGNTSGQTTFPKVPPGYYVAKAYLDSGDTTVFARSSEAVAVEGISIEGPIAHGTNDGAPDTGARSFKISGNASSGFTFDPPAIVLRWAFDGTYMLNPNDPQDILWFVLLKQGDVHGSGDNTQALIKLCANGNRPWKNCKEVMGSHFARGRLPLTADPFLNFIGSHVSGHPQTFEFRIFHDTRGGSLTNPIQSLQLGIASFTVKPG